MATQIDFDENSPANLAWTYGPMASQFNVPRDGCWFLWSNEYAGPVSVWGDDLNPARWVTGNLEGKWHDGVPCGWWTTTRVGDEPPYPKSEE